MKDCVIAEETSSGTTETYTYEPAVYTTEVIECDEPEEEETISYTVTENNNKSSSSSASESSSTTESREYSYDDTPSDDEYITSTVYTPHC